MPFRKAFNGNFQEMWLSYFNGDHGYKPKVTNQSTKGVVGRQATDQTAKKFLKFQTNKLKEIRK